MPRKTYVKFVETTSFGRPAAEVRTLRGDVLGGVAYYSLWRQYTFIPEGATAFSFDCLEDIAAKVSAMNIAFPVARA